MTLVAESVSRSRRGEVMGRMAAFRGLVGFPAPYVGGLLYEHLGFQAPMLANLAGVAAVLALILALVREPTRSLDGRERHS
jgi:MFS family permease